MTSARKNHPSLFPSRGPLVYLDIPRLLPTIHAFCVTHVICRVCVCVYVYVCVIVCVCVCVFSPTLLFWLKSSARATDFVAWSSHLGNLRRQAASLHYHGEKWCAGHGDAAATVGNVISVTMGNETEKITPWQKLDVGPTPSEC